MELTKRQARKQRAQARKDELIGQAIEVGRKAAEPVMGKKKRVRQETFLEGMAKFFEGEARKNPQESEVIRQAADESVTQAFEKYPTVFGEQTANAY